MAIVNILFMKTHVFICWYRKMCSGSYLCVLFLDVSTENQKYYIKVTMFNLFYVSVGYMYTTCNLK